MFGDVIQNNGFLIAVSGLLVVFAGLVLIAIVIFLFNLTFKYLHRDQKNSIYPNLPDLTRVTDTVNLSDEELIAISIAIECYRRIHFEPLPSAITFRQGEQQNFWKNGMRPGVFRR